MITRSQLEALAGVEAAPAISIYLPTHEKGREVRQDPIRFKNLVDRVTEELVLAGQRRPEAEALMTEARRLLEDQEFWRHQGRGLAVFVAPGLFQAYRLPEEVPELHQIGPRPHLKPLLPLLADDGRFYVLAAQADDTRLYAGSRHGLAELDADIPRSVAEVAAETEYENTRHAAPAARPRQGAPVGMPATHNFGEDPEEQRKTQLIEHLRRVHNALERQLGGDRAPIVLVAQPEIQGHLRALAKSIRFHEEGVQTDPDALDEATLHARAYEVVRPLFARAREEALDRFRALAGSNDPRGSRELRAIVSAARFGRVDTLLVAEGQSVWGRHDPQSDQIEIEREPTPRNEDLLDYAAVHTLLQGGAVQVLPRDEMPDRNLACAIFRY